MPAVAFRHSQSQDKLAALVPEIRLIVAEQSGHYIQPEQLGDPGGGPRRRDADLLTGAGAPGASGGGVAHSTTGAT